MLRKGIVRSAHLVAQQINLFSSSLKAEHMQQDPVAHVLNNLTFCFLIFELVNL